MLLGCTSNRMAYGIRTNNVIIGLTVAVDVQAISLYFSDCIENYLTGLECRVNRQVDNVTMLRPT